MAVCDMCIHKCYSASKITCDYFEPKVTEEELKELKYEIARQNVNLPRLAKYAGIDYKKLKKMLSGKLEFTYKYLWTLNHRLSEKDWVIDHIEKNGMGENMNNHFAEDAELGVVNG